MRTHKYGALGWTQGGGNCNPDAVINEYMGLGKAQRYTGGGKSTGKADNVPSEEMKQRREHKSRAGGLFQRQSILSLPIIGFLGLGGKRTSYPVETIVGDYAGKGKTDGLPTTNDNGELDLVYRQVFQIMNPVGKITMHSGGLIWSRLMKMVPGQWPSRLTRHRQARITRHSHPSRLSKTFQVMVSSAYPLEQTRITT